MSLQLALGPKTAQEGPRTHSTQTLDRHLEPKLLKKGAVLRLKTDPKILLDSGAENLVHMDAPRVANGTSGPQMSKNSFGGVVNFSFSHLSVRRLFWIPRGSF